MKTILGLCLAAAFVAFCGSETVRAATCNCALTRVCTCPAGECQCPGCPGNVSNRPIVVQHSTATPLYVGIPVYTPVPVFRVPAVTYQAYQQPTDYYTAPQTSSGCYVDAYGRTICPNQQQQQETYIYRPEGMRGGDWRRVKRAARSGNLIFDW